MDTCRKTARPRRRPLFGPGTIMALMAALYLIGSGWLNAGGGSATGPDRVVYEADAQGRLQPRSAQPPAPASTARTPGLWKPEVGLLLNAGAAIKLDASQSRRLDKLGADWSRERARLLDAMRASTAGTDADLGSARPGRGAAVPLIRRQLGEYSALSREFDASRGDYWAKGLAVLKDAQRERALMLGPSAQGAKR